MRYGSKVPLEKVAKKSRNICWLCQREVDKTLDWPHPMSGTRDHVKRLSEGGKDVLSNVRLAHRVCNEQREQEGVFAKIPSYPPPRKRRPQRFRPISHRRPVPYDRGAIDDDDLDLTG